MPESDSSSSQNSWFSLNGLLAAVTLVGGIVLVSHTLTSQRPQTPRPEGTRPLGYQNIESRLWEDPFAGWDKLSEDEKTNRTSVGLTNDLVPVLAQALATVAPSNVLVLGVMVSGQPYAEDIESRVRARYAVGAALAAAGYNPDEAGHIGLSACRWPSTSELDDWKMNRRAKLRIAPPCEAGTNKVSASRERETRDGLCRAANTNLHLRVPFEKYLKKDFFPFAEFSTNAVTARTNRYTSVLLVWLDEEYFDDAPALRLALFISEIERPLRQKTRQPHAQPFDWAIIGPNSSTTLQSLLQEHSTDTSPQVWRKVNRKLRKARLILATPTAMDEVLVPDPGRIPAEKFKTPRAAVAAFLGHGQLFKTVTNVACTDLQFAAEALDELSLRGIKLANDPLQHLVLISEWDTFFSRMSGLAFAAQMMCLRTNVASVQEFVTQVQERTNAWPANLHRFVYLQGLDGEAAESAGSKDKHSQKEEKEHYRPTSIEEIRQWTPDGNKAEGPTQFDYLARLGDAVGDLDHELWRRDGGRVAAVGIVGSDVYDTLLILQALRVRLPDVVFFTSELDARYWDPRELGWTRNLVVISGYGLQLTNCLQAGVAPFRASSQSAQFLATLSALNDPRVTNLDNLSPRRFEIGRHGPVDLSTNAAWPHPPPRPKAPRHSALELGLAFILCSFPLLGLLAWRAPWRFILPMQEYCCKPLALSEDEFGGNEGTEKAYAGLLKHWKRRDTFASWLLGAPPLRAVLTNQKKTDLIARFNNLVFMNDRNNLPPPLAISRAYPKWFSQRRQKGLSANRQSATTNRLSNSEIHYNYKAANRILRRLLSPTKDPGKAADCARHAALLTYESRQRRWKLFWSTLVAFALLGAGMFYEAWRESYFVFRGQPFNLTGTSAWPAEFIRFGVIAISVIAVFRVQRALGQSLLRITRAYRFVLDKSSLTVTWGEVANSFLNVLKGLLPWTRSKLTDRRCCSPLLAPPPPMPEAEVDADELWNEYTRIRHWKARLVRVGLCVGFYFCAGFALAKLTGMPFRPIRGPFLLTWDFWILLLAVTAMVFVTFWMIDAARLCASFIERLSHRPTRYSPSTLARFAQQRAIGDTGLMEDWIDLQVTADLTEPVSRLVYLPFILLLLMLLARNPLWGHWPWPWSLVAIFGLNTALAAASSIILQRAAHNAREKAIEKLRERVSQKERKAAPSTAAHESSQAKQLLEEIKHLRRGAFAPLSQNPLVGALLLNSSGAVLFQVLAKLLSK